MCRDVLSPVPYGRNSWWGRVRFSTPSHEGSEKRSSQDGRKGVSQSEEVSRNNFFSEVLRDVSLSPTSKRQTLKKLVRVYDLLGPWV